jgi:hypothetical protein
MSAIRRILLTLRRFLGWLWSGAKPRPALEPQLMYEQVEDLPEVLRPDIFYVAGEAPHFWAAAMLCPCGCDAPIHLNLIPQQHPSWRVTLRDGRFVSATPSVWRTRGCRSHFFVRDGRIEWCRSE